MNLVKDLVARIERRLTETKKPCKLYATEAQAEKVAEEQAEFLGAYFTNVAHPRPARYLIVHIPSVGKYAIGFDMTEVMSRKSSIGGYLGVMSDRGFYTF